MPKNKPYPQTYSSQIKTHTPPAATGGVVLLSCKSWRDFFN